MSERLNLTSGICYGISAGIAVPREALQKKPELLFRILYCRILRPQRGILRGEGISVLHGDIQIISHHCQCRPGFLQLIPANSDLFLQCLPFFPKLLQLIGT